MLGASPLTALPSPEAHVCLNLARGEEAPRLHFDSTLRQSSGERSERAARAVRGNRIDIYIGCQNISRAISSFTELEIHLFFFFCCLFALRQRPVDTVWSAELCSGPVSSQNNPLICEQGVFDISPLRKGGNVGRSISVKDGLAMNAQWTPPQLWPLAWLHLLSS